MGDTRDQKPHGCSPSYAIKQIRYYFILKKHALSTGEEGQDQTKIKKFYKEAYQGQKT